MTPDAQARAEYVKGLRILADALEAHPELALPTDGTRLPLTISFWDADAARSEMSAAARVLPTSWDKDADDSYLRLNGRLAGLRVQLVSWREAVCQRVVTGTETREVEEVVTPAVTQVVTREVETVEWVCTPVLAPAGRQDVPAGAGDATLVINVGEALTESFPAVTA